ncbi:hypothetical protein RND71_039665 [Anisodus tanguticus]|uniref:Uncharacterized protein n=1 Tax=Anisodus tanguticus TaxID=243964 RepID=A0AAE1QXV2_9SOLA|nr:hypothetical protein RND71_039665 [Anisodus tanguticus]
MPRMAKGRQYAFEGSDLSRPDRVRELMSLTLIFQYATVTPPPPQDGPLGLSSHFDQVKLRPN